MDKEKWPVHETHCCPKHGCKYGDPNCPVVLRETEKHNKHCELCEQEYEDPEPIDLLLAWANSHSDYSYMGDDEWGHSEHREVISVSDLEIIVDKIKHDKNEIVNLGKKEGWWGKEE